MKQYCYYILLLSFLALTACRGDDDAQRLTLPVSLCLPTGETKMPMYRVPGDPGTTEQFLLPNHVYIIVMKKEGGDWTRWQVIEKTLTEGDWEKKHYVGQLQTTGDSIYQYTEEIDLLLNNQKFEGCVFAVASAEELTFSQALNTLSDSAEVVDLTISVSTTAMQQNIQHIYSTPYNYLRDGKYYGSFSSITQRVPRVNLLLYHIAAKVDLQWSVPADKRINAEDPSQAVRLTYLGARNLFNGNALIFRPMENEKPAVLTGGYAIDDIVTPADEGMWWEGRAYFYTIPYTVTGNTDYFPLQLQLRTNGSAETYQPTLQMNIAGSTVFVPWLRAQFNLTKPLTEKTETLVIDD